MAKLTLSTKKVRTGKKFADLAIGQPFVFVYGQDTTLKHALEVHTSGIKTSPTQFLNLAAYNYPIETHKDDSNMDLFVYPLTIDEIQVSLA